MDDNKSNSRFGAAQAHIQQLTGYALKIAIIILLAVVAWRTAWAKFNFDLSKFEFSDLLALIMALFAIAMAVAFYFKTTDTSNKFYDNSYNFTHKTSEILGRIEERFGERLKHLDEGYGRMQSHFDGINRSSDEIKEKVKETEGKEEEEKQRLKETNEAMQQMMEELAQKAQLQEQEKTEFYDKLAELEAEKNSAQARIRETEDERDQMQMQLDKMEQHMMEGAGVIHSRYVEELLCNLQIRELILHNAPPDILRDHSRRALSKFPSHMIEKLQDEGIVNARRELTTAGALVLRTMMRRHGSM